MKGMLCCSPKLKIYIDGAYEQQEGVMVVGYTSGSHVSALVESQPSSVLGERLRDGLIAAWMRSLVSAYRSTSVICV